MTCSGCKVQEGMVIDALLNKRIFCFKYVVEIPNFAGKYQLSSLQQ